MTPRRHMGRLLTALLLPLLLAACAGKPVDAVPVSNFQSDLYLGKWYEIARLDHSFERGLSNVTANYAARSDGKLTVVNQGYRDTTGKIETAQGIAKFAGKPSKGELRVSFFRPFYGDYIIFGLDPDYRHAFVSGGGDNFLWLLSRSPSVPDAVRQDFLRRANNLGYDTDALIWVDQSRNK